MDNMHLLSFLLTADLTKAEECFVSGLEDCVKGSYVFRNWARSWARRTIIQNAVRMVAPRPSQSAGTAARSETVNCCFERTPEAHAVITSILKLEDFERFVFVMSVLEGYSDQDCSVLLGCSRQDVREARTRAVQNVSQRCHVDTVSRTWTGSNKVITAPLPARSEILAAPPWARTTASTKASPRPCPGECFPFTKRSKARPPISGGNPGPLSSIASSADP